jgi:hypothetical protein
MPDQGGNTLVILKKSDFPEILGDYRWMAHSGLMESLRRA